MTAPLTGYPTMASTRTGSFPIGFRRGGSAWQQDLDALIDFARQQRFEAIDVGPLPTADLQRILDAGLRLGSVDLQQKWADLASPNAGVRRAAVEKNAACIRDAARLGVLHFFTVVFPADEQMKRADAFGYAVEGYRALCEAIRDASDPSPRIVIEGYPGGGPRYPALVATPETYRRFIGAMPAGTCGVNFDPSHLIRMGIDPLRFVREFAPHVYHVHAKDTELFTDALYEFGHTQPATFARSHGFGQWTWRYTIPGHGVAPWSAMLGVLADAGYRGAVSVELEDENFNGTPDGEQRGLLASRDFLVHA